MSGGDEESPVVCYSRLYSLDIGRLTHNPSAATMEVGRLMGDVLVTLGSLEALSPHTRYAGGRQT